MVRGCCAAQSSAWQGAGICVTAEGVESQEQVVVLKNIDCDSIQGFYYSKPLPLAEYEMLLD